MWQSVSGNLPVPRGLRRAARRAGRESRPNPSDPGQSVILTAEVLVVSPGGGTPQGTVIFRDATHSEFALFGDLSGSNGVATASVSVTFATPGPHLIEAHYPSDPPIFSKYYPSTGYATHGVNPTVSIAATEHAQESGPTG